MAAIVIAPLPGAGLGVRLAARVRGWLSRRVLLQLLGVQAVVLEGHAYAVRAVPLGVARELVPALVRCSQRFAAGQFDESLYDDLIKALALGLGTTARDIERLTVPLWDLAPVIGAIAEANGLPVMEVGSADLGKLLAALMTSTGTNSTPSSSAPPAGPGTTSIVT